MAVSLRYVNLNDYVLSLPGPRGVLETFGPGQWTYNSWFSRYAYPGGLTIVDVESGPVPPAPVPPAVQLVPPHQSTLIVAAADSSLTDKASATYVCTGTALNPIDHLTIQQAVNNAQSTTAAKVQRVFFCAGNYYIADTIWVGYDFVGYAGNPYDCHDATTPASRRFVPFLQFAPNSYLHWYGADNDSYMMVYTGKSSGDYVQWGVDGLTVYCMSKCRGLLAMKATYQARFSRITSWASK